MATEDSRDWIKYLSDVFNEAKTVKELVLAGTELWHHRFFADVWGTSIPMYRKRMEELWPNYKRHAVVAVDLSAVLHAAWHTQGANKEHPIKMLRNIYRSTDPSIFILCADSKSPRKQMCEAFKADRDPLPQEAFDMFSAVHDEMKQKDKVLYFKFPGYEADDIMASIAFRCQTLGQPCVLATDDKDAWQCLGTGTALWGIVSHEFRNAQWLEEKHGISPHQAVDWLSLVGGKNNVPGCPKIGEKTATELLQEHGDVLGIHINADKLTPKIKESFTEFYKDMYWKIKEIHTLNRGAPVWWEKK